MNKIRLTSKQAQQAADLYTSEKFADSYAAVSGVDASEVEPRSSAREIYSTISDRAAQMRAIFENDGFDPVAGKKVSMSDAFSQFDAPIVMPQVMDEMLVEAQEPLLQIAKSFSVISGENVDAVLQQFPAVGALEAADMAYGQEYPERQLIMEGGVTFAKMAKSGLAVAIEEETIKDSRFDLVALHLRAMGAALARHKEKKCWNALDTYGQIMFDNDTPASAVFGQTSGRAYDGSRNGTITGDDIMKAWGHSATQGFPFDTLFVNPLAWTMFLRDPVLRVFAINGLRQFYGAWQGSQTGPMPNFGNLMGISGGFDLSAFGVSTQSSQVANSVPVAPDYFPIPLAFVPTPIVPYNPVTKETDIVAVSTGNSGVIVQKDPISIGDWTVESRDVRKIKASERYGVGIANAGLGVYTFKNVAVDFDSVFISPMYEISSDGTSL